jgi:hypothetical protein
MLPVDRREELRRLEEALAAAGDFDDETLDLYNAFDGKRFSERVGELVDDHPEAAELRRRKKVPEDQPLDVPVPGEVSIIVPRGLTLQEWALSERFEEPVEVFVHRGPDDLLHVGIIRRDDVRRA